jgi:hypothetical protein
MVDVGVAEPSLDRSRVVAVIRQFVAARMAKHVRMHREREPGTLGNALDLSVNGVRSELAATLGREDKRRAVFSASSMLMIARLAKYNLKEFQFWPEGFCEDHQGKREASSRVAQQGRRPGFRVLDARGRQVFSWRLGEN